MKLINIVIVSLLLTVSFGACHKEKKASQPEASDKKETVEQSPVDADQVAVYYFHSTRRCETCLAIESVSSKAVKEFWGEAIPFESFNIEKEHGAAKAKEMGVKSSALLILRGDEKIDITSEAFMYGRMQSDKLEALIKSKIEPVKNL